MLFDGTFQLTIYSKQWVGALVIGLGYILFSSIFLLGQKTNAIPLPKGKAHYSLKK